MTARALIPEWVDDELRNWARWCWSGAWPHPVPASRAESIEGRYTAESVLGVEVAQEEAARRSPPANARRAEIVQVVYAQQLSRAERRALVVRYVKPNPSGDEVWARRAGLSVDVFHTAIVTASRLVAQAFDARYRR